MKPFSLLIKPASADCNLRCDYCFYLEKSGLYPDSAVHRMSEEVLSILVSSYMSTPQPVYQFGWQGGEPSLMGARFYEKAVRLQEHRGGPGTVVSNGIQTNALDIPGEMAEVFARYNFLAGVSLDGPPDIHDAFRKHADGRPTHSRVMKGIEKLKNHGVEFNILTLVTSANAADGARVYRYLRDKGFRYHQYIPCVEFDGNGMPRPFSITGEQWGMFMCGVFDEWLKKDSGKVSVRLFDSILNLMVLGERNVCHMGKDCRQYLVVEHNGDVYPCDFFVEEDKKLGNITGDSWEELLESAEYAAFGKQKTRLNQKCAGCAFLDYCAGDCLKNRFIRDRNPGALSWLCSGWEMFFSRALPALSGIAEELRRKTGRPGRNDPCPCGSGRKFKHCHLNKP